MNRYQKTFDTWDKIAALYQQHFMDIDLYNDTYDFFCHEIKTSNASILEIGCGPGNITKYLLKKRPDLIIDATDVSPNMIALAKQNNPAANCYVMDARNIGDISNRYNGVMCGFCLPYLSKEDTAALIQNCFDLLLPGGVFYCSVIEGSYHQSGYETNSYGDSAYVYYYGENDIRTLLDQHGFNLLQSIRKQYQKNDGSNQIHLILIVEK